MASAAPLASTAAVVSFNNARVQAAIGRRTTTILSLAFLSIGALGTGLLGAGAPPLVIAVALVPIGLGFGLRLVRGLAKVLGVSKPVVTRALNTLGALGYLRRERDQDDRRNVFVVRTKDGAEFLEGFKRNLRESDRASAANRPIIGQAAFAHQR